MIRISILSFMVLCFTNLYSQKRAGIFTTYGLRNKLVGIGFNGQFFFGEKFSITPEFNYNFAKRTIFDYGTFTTEEVYNTWSLACDFNSYFVKKDMFEFYGLFGLNLATEKNRVTNIDNNTHYVRKYTELGLNLGIGTNFNASGKLVPYAQAKYELNSVQLVLHVGVRYNLE